MLFELLYYRVARFMHMQGRLVAEKRTTCAAKQFAEHCSNELVAALHHLQLVRQEHGDLQALLMGASADLLVFPALLSRGHLKLSALSCSSRNRLFGGRRAFDDEFVKNILQPHAFHSDKYKLKEACNLLTSTSLLFCSRAYCLLQNWHHLFQPMARS